MPEDDKKDPHLHDERVGLIHGVPSGATQEESKGLPDTGRHESETAVHPEAQRE